MNSDSTKKLRVLLVAPKSTPGHATLPWADDEIQAIVNSGLRVQLERDVNERLLVELLSKPNYDVLWFAGVGDTQGVYLSDGILTTASLSSIVKGSSVSYVVLNTCESVHAASEISRNAAADVICTIAPVEDKTAWRTAAIFANNLAQGLSAYDAFLKARPAQSSTYIYLPGTDGRNEKGAVRDKMTALSNANLTPLLQNPGPVNEEAISGLDQRVTGLEDVSERDGKRITALERKLSPPLSAILWLLAAAAVMLADVFAIFTVLNNDELRTIAARIPLIFIFGEVILIALVVTWTRQAVLITRGSEGKQ